MAKLNPEQVKETIDNLTPEYLQVKGGQFAEYTVTLEDDSVYAQSVARVLHANAEHAARDSKYDIYVKSILPLTQTVEGKEVPIAVITIEVDSPVFGKRQNVMTAVLDTSEHGNDKIGSSFAIEKAVTQAIGRTLALYGFVFTGTMVNAEEVREGKDRAEKLEEAKKEDPVDLLKKEIAKKGLDFDEVLSRYEVTEEQLNNSRPLVFRVLNQVRRA